MYAVYIIILSLSQPRSYMLLNSLFTLPLILPSSIYQLLCLVTHPFKPPLKNWLIHPSSQSVTLLLTLISLHRADEFMHLLVGDHRKRKMKCSSLFNVFTFPAPLPSSRITHSLPPLFSHLLNGCEYIYVKRSKGENEMFPRVCFLPFDAPPSLWKMFFFASIPFRLPVTHVWPCTWMFVTG